MKEVIPSFAHEVDELEDPGLIIRCYKYQLT